MAGNLFHYTDAMAVKAILENRELWLSDIRFLNDSQEMNDGVKYVVDVLRADIPDFQLDEKSTAAATEFLMETFDDHVSKYMDDEPTFVCSFSEAGNQLSQWRAYGGYAIEFDRAVMEGALDLFQCLYDDTEKKEYASKMVYDAIHGLAADLTNNNGVFGSDFMNYSSLLVRTASIFKHESFYEEREVRCAIDVALPTSELKFRSKGGLLIPYVTSKFPLEAIKAIHVGPMRDQELAFTSIKALVSMINHSYPADGDAPIPEIYVVMSKIPYRASS
ncbi:DUF2971 domain-containing protein [Pseudomonas sp. SWRI111]|uniref:DUF2971 domain-containing protein n=1 Tax=Pseudomonas sp. SWRI111 TaxID=2745507 RepID=UPI001644491A|nr:DUF2971 domain-containing protein [Pseudomonas sp. SWRI111]MBC3209325.1 DUF2971 domain-containing protein [Pseudomonas sp. SWRI111]